MVRKGLFFIIACLAVLGAVTTGCNKDANAGKAAPTVATKEELNQYLDEMAQLPQNERRQMMMTNRQMMMQIAKDPELKKKMQELMRGQGGQR